MHGSRLPVCYLIGTRNRKLQGWCSEEYPCLLKQSFCIKSIILFKLNFREDTRALEIMSSYCFSSKYK
jgi:hypothetical protein